MIKKRVKKVFGVCFGLNKKCLMGDIPTFETKAGAKKYIKELHKEIGGFEDDHHIIPLFLVPITKDKDYCLLCHAELPLSKIK